MEIGDMIECDNCGIQSKIISFCDECEDEPPVIDCKECGSIVDVHN